MGVAEDTQGTLTLPPNSTRGPMKGAWHFEWRRTILMAPQGAWSLGFTWREEREMDSALPRLRPPRNFSIRSYRRFRLDCPIYFLGNQFLGKGTVVNVSRVGWRIQGDYLVQPGHELALRVALPDDERPIAIERARVRWSYGSEFGMEMLLIDPKEKARLNRFISSLVPRMHSPDS